MLDFHDSHIGLEAATGIYAHDRLEAHASPVSYIDGFWIYLTGNVTLATKDALADHKAS